MVAWHDIRVGLRVEVAGEGEGVVAHWPDNVPSAQALVRLDDGRIVAARGYQLTIR